MAARKPRPVPQPSEPAKDGDRDGVIPPEGVWVDRGEEGWFHIAVDGTEDGPHLLPPDQEEAASPDAEPEPELDPVEVRQTALDAAWAEYNEHAAEAWADYVAEAHTAWDKYEAALRSASNAYQARAERIRKA